MAADALEPFQRWVSKRAELWSHLHFAAVAVRVGQDWFALAGALLMAPTGDPPRRSGCPVFGTDEICALSLVAPAATLGTLVDGIRRGAILVRPRDHVLLLLFHEPKHSARVQAQQGRGR